MHYLKLIFYLSLNNLIDFKLLMMIFLSPLFTPNIKMKNSVNGNITVLYNINSNQFINKTNWLKYEYSIRKKMPVVDALERSKSENGTFLFNILDTIYELNMIWTRVPDINAINNPVNSYTGINIIDRIIIMIDESTDILIRFFKSRFITRIDTSIRLNVRNIIQKIINKFSV